MVSLSTWFRYLAHKFEYSVSISYKSYKKGLIGETEIGDTLWKNLFVKKLTYMHWNKGEEMAPTVGGQMGALLVRKLPAVDPTNISEVGLKQPCTINNDALYNRIFVGDVVLLKDPVSTDNYLVRRLAAIEGYEMASKDEKDEPFILEKDQCWVLADNEALKPKEANDSRTFGPVSMANIVGRVIYSLRTAVDHGPVHNSHFAMQKDSPVLEVELDVDEMARSGKV